ncbi:hypothetical protein [Novosphingobium pentaromativorans]|uniref:Uncharacterized protein n=1 Tax=Novosphingobium pentaromativorans US6-1 TaxID=1088721 RepID=G6EFA4_9SPHN|nr:hypothetical protein [Novosphingobium pentaromativorans]EHJ60062.1 hypothetical protein NSU_3025 [Novosphingobium pentaromativorans US6-1]
MTDEASLSGVQISGARTVDIAFLPMIGVERDEESEMAAEQTQMCPASSGALETLETADCRR